MIHIIKNQHNDHIIDEDIRVEINHALDNDLEYTYFKKKRIDIVSDTRRSKERVTIVKAEL